MILRTLILLLLFCQAALCQVASVSHATFKEAQAYSLPKKRALEYMKKPQSLLSYWGDEAVPVEQYSKVERAFQQQLNEHLAQDFVLAYSPAHKGSFPEDNISIPIAERHIDNEPITPYTWKWVTFHIIHEDGGMDEVKLCRPNWWLRMIGADRTDTQAYLHLPELGIMGSALIAKIQVCQLDTRFLNQKREGDYSYQPLTGIFKHQQGYVWDYKFSNGEIIGATSNHPFFSLDRNDFVSVGDLRIGECVKTQTGISISLVAKHSRPKPEPVYNLEVYRDHTYLVGKEGIVVHNSCLTALLSDIRKWVHTEFNAQSLERIREYERRLLANDPWIWQEPIYTTVINGKTYLLDGHHRIQAAMNINFSGEIPHIDIPIADIAKFRGGQYKNAQDVIIASKKIR